MGHFQQIYQAAKDKNRTLLVSLFSKKACIDERDRRGFYTTPAGKLSREGDFESAYFLVNEFGASIEYVLYGLYLGEHLIEANALRERYQLSNNADFKRYLEGITRASKSMEAQSHAEKIFGMLYNSYNGVEFSPMSHLMAAIVTGDMDFVNTLEAIYGINVMRNDLIYYAVYGGHLYFIEQLCVEANTFDLSRNSLDMFYLRGYHKEYEHDLGFRSLRFSSEALALHSLSFISSDLFFHALIGNLMLRYEYTPYNLLDVAAKAKIIRQIMKEQKKNYPDALEICNALPVTQQPPRGPYYFSNSFFYSHSFDIKTDDQGRNTGFSNITGSCNIS